MKKVLFATTALVATAGVASADVSISGFAEMGIFGGDGIADQFHSDIDVTFSMTGETDGGLSFGTAIDIDEVDGGDSIQDGADQGNDGTSVFVSSGGATLTLGDTDGALDAAMSEAIIGSSLADDLEHAGYNGNGGLDGSYDDQVARFSYNFDRFTGHFSIEQDDDLGSDNDPTYGLGAEFNQDFAGLSLGVGIGFQAADEDANTFSSAAGISVSTTLNNGIQAILNASSREGDNVETESHIGVAFGYTRNALTVGVNFGAFENVGGVEDDTATGAGIAVNYDLGGGASAQFGYGFSETETGGVTTEGDTYSLGLAMNF